MNNESKSKVSELEQFVKDEQTSTKQGGEPIEKGQTPFEVNYTNKILHAENNVADYFMWAYVILLGISIICFLVGVCTRHGELYLAIGISGVIINSIWYFLIKPIIYILVGISRNLRELNNKTK